MTRRFTSLALLASVLALPACAADARKSPPATYAESPAQAGRTVSGSGSSGYAQPESVAPAPMAPSGMRDESARRPGALADRAESAPAEETERPGLGTSWGEQRDSRITTVRFDRDDYDTPYATAVFSYNDERGVEAMSRGGFVSWTDSVTSLGNGITVSIAEPGGRALRAARIGGRLNAIGHDGDRYVIHVENRSGVRLEAVATVDGLDVMDGGDGSIGKRGYIVDAYGSLDIDGFRESSGTVRAFRFGATDDSYAARTGKGRDVGVIGVAVFAERGSDFRWTRDEIDRRETADPFPGRYAPAPPSRWR